MATVSAPTDQAAELLQKLSLDPLDKPLQDAEPAKKTSAAQYTPTDMAAQYTPTDMAAQYTPTDMAAQYTPTDMAAQYTPTDTAAQTNGLNKPFERTASPHPDFMDPSMFYNPGGYPSSTYYYGGFNGSAVNDWDWYGSSNGVDMPPPVYGDYQNGYGYGPYATYSSSGSTFGQDNQLYGAQNYQYPGSYFPPVTSNGQAPANGVNTSQANVSAPVPADPVQLSTGSGNQSSVPNVVNSRDNVSKPARQNYQSSYMKSNNYYGWGGFPSAGSGNSSAYSYGNNYPSGRSQNQRPMPHLVHPHAGLGMDQTGYGGRMYPNHRMYGQYSSSFRRGAGYGSSNYDSRLNGRGWLSVDYKYRSRGRGGNALAYGNESVDGLNELNKGPRSKGIKDPKDPEHITLVVKGQSFPVEEKSNEESLPVFPDREQYNREDFPDTFTDARFYVIKSYSEDDVHKSIKYGVWASTPNGNKKLDAAYKEAKEKSAECPVFLLFSVNASGQFVGLAEMTGPVDFEKSLDFWQQDKWTGGFPVKWHIVKDIPNSLLRRLVLENNENKPVTNSRDTQEVLLEQGLELIKMFKNHSSKTCILDDFEFYEGRQKAMQEKKAKQKQFYKQVGDVALNGTEKDGLTSNVMSQTSVDLSPGLVSEATATGPTAAVPAVEAETSPDLKFLKEDGPAVVDKN